MKPVLPAEATGSRAALFLSPDSKPNQTPTATKPAENQPQAPAQDALTCTCICTCFGYFKYNEWPNLDSETNKLQMPVFEEGDIKILYRDKIKIFFKTAKDALDANYTDFDESDNVNKKKRDGYIYSFTGLRGDAK